MNMAPEFFSKCGLNLKSSHSSEVLVSCCSSRSPGAGARPDGRVISAQYFSDLSICISELDCASVPSNLLYSMKFSWLSSLRKSICAMCFSDGGNVLIIATIDLCLYLVDVDSLCEAKTISNDEDDMEETLLNRSTRTTEGIVSLSSICSQVSTTELPLLSSMFCVEMSLGQQLKPDGGELSDLERFVETETPTCITCFCPASVVIHRLLINRDIKARGLDLAQSLSPDDFSSKCDGRFVLLGHASGRVTIINISSSIRHVVWSTFLDNGSPISSLSLFSDLASLSEQGIWSLPREYIDHRDDDPSQDNNESTTESLEASIMGSLFPTIINVPGCSVLIGSTNHYFRLPLERSHPSPFSERRAAAEVAQALWSLTDGSRANAQGINQTSQHNRLYRNVPSWATDLPEPKWTQTILDITSVAAVSAFVQRSDSTATLPSDAAPRISTKETRPGTIRFFPVNSDAQQPSLLPSSSSQLPLQTGSNAEQKHISSVFPNVLATSSSKSAPVPKNRRRQSFAGMLGFAELETQQEKIETSKQVKATSRFPTLPATFRMLPSEFRPVRLHQSPRRCHVSSEVSVKRKTSVVTVLYLTNDSKFLIFDPSLGDQPLFEMLLPSRSRESTEALSHVFSSLKTDVKSSQLLTVKASFIAYADGIVFMGENILVEPQQGAEISEEASVDQANNDRNTRSSQALIDVENTSIQPSSESFVSEADISVDDEVSKTALESQPATQATAVLSAASIRAPLLSYRGRIFIISANLAQRSFRDVQLRQKSNASDSLSSSTLNEPLLVPSDAILQTFDLNEGEVITGMQRLLLPMAPTASKPNAMNVSLVVSTSKSVFCLTGRDVNDGPSLIKRLVKKEISEDDSGSLSEITMSLLKRITYINRLAFALGIVAADAILSLADDTCSVLAENPDLEAEDVNQSLSILKQEPKFDSQQDDGPLDFLSINVQSIRIGSLSRCKLVEQAFALYTIASANPLRVVKGLASAGRPDLSVAYAAGALGEGSFESMAEENWRLFPKGTTKPPGPLPTGSFASRQPSPADRTRLANLLLQCQLIVMKTISKQDRFQCRAFSQESFGSWLAQSSDLQPEKAIPWLTASGFAYEALIVAHSRITSAKGLMIMALTSIANTGIDCLVESEQCLQFLGLHGYENELFTFGGGLFLRALSPSSVKHFAMKVDEVEDKDSYSLSMKIREID